MKKIILTLALSSVSLAGFAQEEVADNTKDLYIQLNAGYARGFKPGANFGSNSLKRTGLYGIEFGANVYEHLRASLSFEYMPNFSGSYIYNGNASSSVNYATNNNFKVKSYVAMANLYYDIGEYNRFTPYFMMGVGMSKNKTSQVNGNGATTNSDPNQNITTSTPGAAQTNFAYKLGFGTRYELTKAFSLDLRYQFSDLGKFKTGALQIWNVSGTPGYQAASNSGKLRAHGLTMGVVYKF